MSNVQCPMSAGKPAELESDLARRYRTLNLERLLTFDIGLWTWDSLYLTPHSQIPYEIFLGKGCCDCFKVRAICPR